MVLQGRFIRCPRSGEDPIKVSAELFLLGTRNEEKVLPSDVMSLKCSNDSYSADINALHKAAEEGNETTIEELISCGLDVDSRHDPSEVTPLYLAAANGHNSTLILLLYHGANIEAKVETEVGKLHLLSYAVYKINTLAVTNLLNNGAEVNLISTRVNIAPTHWGVEPDNIELAEIVNRYNKYANVRERNYSDDYQCLIDNFKYLPLKPLSIAAFRCSEDMVQLLAKRGSSIDGAKEEISPLEIPVYKGCEKVALKLLKLGASTNTTAIGWHLLHWAVLRKMVEVIKYIINLDLLNDKDRVGRTPLHLAVREDEHISKMLLAHRADVNAKDMREFTPLYLVRSPELAQLLLESGAEVNTQNGYGYTPLIHHMMNKSSVNIVKVLLKHNASVDITLHADFRNDLKTYKQFLEIVLPKQIKNNSTPVRGLTPLALAACSGIKEIFLLIIKKNKSMLNPENHEWPPLHAAVFFCQSFGDGKWLIDNLKFIVEQGADVDIRDNYNLTALHKACMAGRIAAVNGLLNLRADVNAVDINGWTPLHAAVYNQNIKISLMLIEAGSEINITDRSGFTTLMWAVIGYRPNFFELMVEKTLELSSINRYHYLSNMGKVHRDKIDSWISLMHENEQPESIFDLNFLTLNITKILSSSEYIEMDYDKFFIEKIENNTKDHIDLIRMIINKNDDSDKEDQVMGWTALHWASASGDFGAVKLLVERGAHLNTKSYLDHTPMFLARYWGQKGIYEYLKQHGAIW